MMLQSLDIVIVLKVFGLAVCSTLVAAFFTPFLTHFLYKHQLWRKEARTKTITGEEASVFYGLHKERETNVPRFGGLIVWVVPLLVIMFFFFLSRISENHVLQTLNFFSREQTWLPLFALVSASLLGLADDALQVSGKGKYIAGGMTFKKRLALVSLIGAVGAWWFYSKLGWSTIFFPFLGEVDLGWAYVPLFILTMLGCWSGGIVDGLDGLAGGTFASIFMGFSVISIFNGQADLAAFCAVIAGAILTFLWFNIPPARFYMSETGTMGLTCTLAVVAFLTDSVVVLPIIAGILAVESGSVILQLLSKKIRKKKIFLCSPLHHHFEAKGWPAYKVTMRFWVIGVVLAIVGVAIRMLGQ
jgi:phospho-N-acetylmuramoyl-pentapeptide-transferase